MDTEILSQESLPSQLRAALEYQQQTLLPVFQTADRTAVKDRANHTRLAKITIFSGTWAILLAILQMAIARELPTLVYIPLALEAIAVLAGLLSVFLGLRTHRDHRWLSERNRAERLRMLKFESLSWPSLFLDNLDQWKQELDAKISVLSTPYSIEQVKDWVAIETPLSEKNPSSPISIPKDLIDALTDYYVENRLAYQIAYFQLRATNLSQQARPWRHLSHPLFAVSTLCVLVHFASDWQHHRISDPHLAHIWGSIGVWSLALAAMIPVAGLGIRVWLSAFEPQRSANLFLSKSRVLSTMSDQFEQSKSEPEKWTKQMQESEHFFQSEHREWLRLMLETEWMM